MPPPHPPPTHTLCSVHARENEGVVAAVLEEAAAAGFHLRDPFPGWPRRGVAGAVADADKLVRVDPDLDGTDGFFVALWVKDGSGDGGEGSGGGGGGGDQGGSSGNDAQGGEELQQQQRRQQQKKKRKQLGSSGGGIDDDGKRLRKPGEGKHSIDGGS